MRASVHIHVLLIVNRLVRSSAGMQQLTTTTETITNMQMNTITNNNNNDNRKPQPQRAHYVTLRCDVPAHSVRCLKVGFSCHWQVVQSGLQRGANKRGSHFAKG